VRPLPPLMLPAGHVGEVVAADEHVARTDGLSEVDDGVIALVVVVVADPARVPALHDADGAVAERRARIARGNSMCAPSAPPCRRPAQLLYW